MKKILFILILSLLISVPVLAEKETMITESEINTAHNHYDQIPISVTISFGRAMNSENYAIKTTVRYTANVAGNKRKRVSRSFLFYPVVGKIVIQENQLVWDKGDGIIIPVANKKGATWHEKENITLKYEIDYKLNKMIFSTWAEIE